MAHHEIKTSILIQATPQKVWSILTNFAAYPNWNPFITSISGEVVEGQNIKASIGGMSFKPKILVAKKNEELRWLGKLFISGLFDGEHIFKLEDLGNGTVNFRQEEKFAGILVSLFSKKLDTDTRAGFELMNEKLKELAEV